MFLNLLIVSALWTSTSDELPAGGHDVEVFRCDFGEQADANYDLWPDGWTRLRGTGYPQYLKIGIVAEELVGQALSVKLDGGAALLTTPLIPVGSRFSYVADAKLRTLNLNHDVASVSLVFLDEQRQMLEEMESQLLLGSTSWTSLRIGPIAPKSEKTRFAVLKFHVRPTLREDIRGEAQLAELRLSRLPRMTLQAGGLRHQYFLGEPIAVATDISGMSAQENKVVFELLDPYGKTLARQEQALSATMVPPVPGDTTSSLAASASWKPPITEPGFYRVNVSMVGEDGLLLKRTTSLVVIERQPQLKGREFGWSVPEGEGPCDIAELADLVANAGVSRVKLPAWFREDDLQRADQLAWLAERLDQSSIEMIGLLDQAPTTLPADGKQPIALTLNEREVWQPLLDPVMMRLSMKVHWWQLGSDEDTSFSGDARLTEKLTAVKTSLDRYGQDLRLALVWSSDKNLPAEEQQPWGALALSELPANETPEHAVASGPRWLTLTSLPRSGHSVAQRAADLVQRMIAARVAGVETVFAAHAFHDDQGLLNADGTPGELLLPWRSVALALNGREYLGSMRLPGGSSNHVFADDREAVMVLWNEHSAREHAYLGQQVGQVDLWGRSSDVPTEIVDGIAQQVVHVGTEPVILRGLDPSLVRWCLSFKFERPQLESLFGREQTVVCQFRNTFAEAISGEFALTAAALCDPPPPPEKFSLAAGQEFTARLPIQLKSDADSGTQRVRIDFSLAAEPGVRFSILRSLTVGLDDITVLLTSHLEDSGDLLVKAEVVNNTGSPINFRGTLFAPGRRRDQQPLTAPHAQPVIVTFRLPNGRELAGQDLRLRLEELGGSRLLNNHLRVPQ